MKSPVPRLLHTENLESTSSIFPWDLTNVFEMVKEIIGHNLDVGLDILDEGS